MQCRKTGLVSLVDLLEYAFVLSEGKARVVAKTNFNCRALATSVVNILCL